MVFKERRTQRREFSEDFMEFFSFRNTSKNDDSLSFGYDSKVVSYYSLARNAHTDKDYEEGKPDIGDKGYSGYQRVHFSDHGHVMRDLALTARALYGIEGSAPIKIEHVDQHMLSTTNPFRVTAAINNKKHVFYLKQPSTKRAVGKAFYNLLVDDKFITYKFNEDGFAVDSVPGKEIEDEDREELVRHMPFVEELVRLNVFTNLVFLDDIMKQTNANCSYSDRHGIYLFDFDNCFTEGDYLVMSRFKDIRQKVHIPSIERDERRKIFRGLWDNASSINMLLDVASNDLPEFQLANRRGAEDLGHLLRREFNKFGAWHRR